MYDGIKIECALSDPRKWDASLRNIGQFDEATGEVMPFGSEASERALKFYKTPSATGTRYTIQGSLHRYARNGGTNSDDFTLAEVHETIANLRDTFGIIPEKSKINNFEFGVNVRLPDGITTEEFKKYIVSAYTRTFEKMNQRGPLVGYIAEFEEFSIKLYDKGMQAETGETQLMRVEVKVMRTRWLEQYGVINRGASLYLSDLLRPDTIHILGDILLNKVSSLILTPRHIDEKKLNQKERLTFRECCDARSWEEWNSKKRADKKQQLHRIFLKVGQQNPGDVLGQLVAEKWRELSRFRPLVDEPKNPKKETISTVVVVGICDLIRQIIIEQIGLFRSWFTTTHAHRHRSILNHQPRGEPLLTALFTPEIIIGFRRWIDLNIRSPDN